MRREGLLLNRFIVALVALSALGVSPKLAVFVSPLPAHALLSAPAIDQWPALPNGCEVTALSMLLQFEGVPVSNMTLAHEVARAKTPRVVKNGQVVRWGDPDNGFVGSMRHWSDGFGVYNGPIAALARRYLGGDVWDQTGTDSSRLLRDLATGRPVEVWTNVTFKPVYDWVTWQSDHGPVTVTYDEHAVLLVGYTRDDIILNNPENGAKDEKVPRGAFLASWRQMGRQAITVYRNRG